MKFSQYDVIQQFVIHLQCDTWKTMCEYGVMQLFTVNFKEKSHNK